MSYLSHISTSVLDELRNNIDRNIDRYQQPDGFFDKSADLHWNVSTPFEVDMDLLKSMRHGKDIAQSDLENSVLAGKALASLTPAIACREEVWVRLTHVECYEYARERWLPGTGKDKLAKSIRDHFFAPGRTGLRDDNAVARLWWNFCLAKKIMPAEPRRALACILKSADIRQALVERPWLSTRTSLGAAIVRIMETVPEATKNEKVFRAFIKTVNIAGGGVVFEIMKPNEIDSFLASCLEKVLG